MYFKGKLQTIDTIKGATLIRYSTKLTLNRQQEFLTFPKNHNCSNSKLNKLKTQLLAQESTEASCPARKVKFPTLKKYFMQICNFQHYIDMEWPKGGPK